VLQIHFTIESDFSYLKKKSSSLFVASD